MRQLATAFAEIALFRRGPDSLPDSTFLLVLTITVDAVMTLLQLGVESGLGGIELVMLAGNVALSLAFTFAVLTFFKLERRFRQTVSALFGAGAFISFVYLPFAMLALAFGADLAAQPFAWFRLGVLIWSVFVGAFILARSLSQPLVVGFMFEMLYLLTWFGILEFLIADPDAAGSATS